MSTFDLTRERSMWRGGQTGMGLPRSENLLILERGAKIPAGGKKEKRQREVLQLQ